MQKEDASKAASSKGGSSKHKKDIIPAHAPASEEVKAVLESVKAPPQSKDAKIMFDAKNLQYLSSMVSKQDDEKEDGNASPDQPRIYVYDSTNGKLLPSESVCLSEILSLSPQSTVKDGDSKEVDVNGKEEGEKTSLGDSLSILRFVRGNKSKRLEISPSGKY
jgi:hypothetical protein